MCCMLPLFMLRLYTLYGQILEKHFEWHQKLKYPVIGRNDIETYDLVIVLIVIPIVFQLKYYIFNNNKYKYSGI